MRVLSIAGAAVFFLLQTDAFSQRVLHTFRGEPDSHIGHSVDAAGDVDGDGFPDIIYSGKGPAATGPDSWVVTVFSTRTGTPIRVISAPNSTEVLGNVSSAGDINHDGHADLLLGIPGVATAGEPRVRVISGLDGTLLLAVDIDIGEGWWGSALADCGDLDNDGYVDFLAGALPRHATHPGRVHAFSGRDGTVLHDLTGSQDGDDFGYSLSGAGDLDLDGHADFIVGAPADNFATGDEKLGYARVFSGRTGSQLFEFVGDENRDWFGKGVSGGGDVNGDGIPDLICGAPGDHHFIWPHRSGYAVAYSGQDGSKLFRLDGEYPGEIFGWAVDCNGDVNDDGHDDLLVAIPGLNEKGSGTGGIRVYSGKDGSELYTVPGEETWHIFPESMAFAGDLNQDGHADFIGGTPYTNHPPGDGTIRIYSGSIGEITPFGQGCPGAGGLTPGLRMSGWASPSGIVMLELINGLGGSLSLLFVGSSKASLPLGGGCELLLFPIGATYPVPLSGSGPGDGWISLTIQLPAATPVGTYFMQALVPDAAGAKGYSMSNALSIEIL